MIRFIQKIDQSIKFNKKNKNYKNEFEIKLIIEEHLRIFSEFIRSANRQVIALSFEFNFWVYCKCWFLFWTDKLHKKEAIDEKGQFL